MNKKIISLGVLAVVIVCSALAGMIIATSFNLSPISKAENFWLEGDTNAPSKVVMPSINSLARELSPSIVNIRITKHLSAGNMYKRFRSPGTDDDMLEDFFKKFFEAMPEKDKQMEQKSLGSGFIISPDGFIITNEHVISDAEHIRVSLSDKEEFDAKIIGIDDKLDIALIKIDTDGKKLPAVELGNSDRLEIGDWVMAIGNPFGLGHTVTMGIVSAKSRIVGAGPYDNFIQTDAAINPGNSGGPLINMKGQVIGINNMIVAAAQGIGFAIPINMAKEILPELKTTGKVTRGWLGVSIQEVTPKLAEALGLKEARGALVTMVYPGDPADTAGVQKRDIILAINDTPIKDNFTLTHLIGTLKPGSKITITVWRDKKELKLSTKLEKRTDEHIASFDEKDAPEKDNEAKKDKLGLSIQNITAELAKQLNLEDTMGVLVAGVDSKGAAAYTGIRKGDVIREVNQKKIHNVDDYLKTLEAYHRGDTILLLTYRQGKPFYLPIEMP